MGFETEQRLTTVGSARLPAFKDGSPPAPPSAFWDTGGWARRGRQSPESVACQTLARSPSSSIDPLPAPDGDRRPTEVGVVIRSEASLGRASARVGNVVQPLISGAEIQGSVLMWTWIGDEGATTFSC